MYTPKYSTEYIGDMKAITISPAFSLLTPTFHSRSSFVPPRALRFSLWSPALASHSFPSLLPKWGSSYWSARSVFNSRSIVSMAEVTEPVEVLVKAATGNPDKPGDCPFSQRVLLTLEEKGVPYKAQYIDLSNKPSWFLEANPEGKVPVIKHQGKWVSDSDVITQLLEEQFPEPSLKPPEDKTSIGSKVFSSFVKFLKSKDPNDGTEQALLEELKALNDYLRDNGPYINGDKISAVDLSLAPKLYHLKVALGHFKEWSVPDDLTYLHDYVKNVLSRESFVKTKAPEEHVIAGWQQHVS